MAKIKINFLALSIVVMVLTFFSQESHAFYTTVKKSTSVITAGEIRMLLHEETNEGVISPEHDIYNIMPGDVISRIVYVENVCQESFYTRIKLIYGVDSEELSPDCFKVNFNTDSFTYVDGWYYYNYDVDPGQCTPYFFTNIEIIGSKVDNSYLGKTLSLKVVAQAVQSKNNQSNDTTEMVYGWPAE